MSEESASAITEAPPEADVTVLVVDDDDGNRTTLEKILSKEGYRVLHAASGEAALEILRAEDVHVVLTDLKMPGMDGVELLRTSKELRPGTEVVLMTAYGTVERAVEAMKDGAYDFITKPFKRHQIVKSIRLAAEKHHLAAENRRLRARLDTLDGASIVLGTSAAMKVVMDVVQQAAPSTATVLIEGESGVGKDVIARSIHQLSPRADKPFRKINCAAIPENLMESELFGYERGAFTGAVARKPGLFELANGGTLFLDEVGELPVPLQAKLLRVLQEGEFERLGGTKTIKVDVRVVCATNANLTELIASKQFREDLYYRLNVIQILIPPLRERPEDIPILAEHFLRKYAARNDKPLQGFDDDAMERLTRHNWPGNVRQLENAIERAVVMCRGDTIRAADLPPGTGDADAPSPPPRHLIFPVGTPLAEIKRRAIRETLAQAGGDKELAARLLGIASRTIYRQLEEERKEEEDAAAKDE